jgi:hypothetical protein
LSFKDWINCSAYLIFILFASIFNTILHHIMCTVNYTLVYSLSILMLVWCKVALAGRLMDIFCLNIFKFILFIIIIIGAGSKGG